ncbi:MAG: hypothetical protein K0U86_04035 [Planctomycetes bacterium]|nr:hypothetical protein [Planctomycetota bacterium]MCH9724055.1 hypothetical protein [Planctomycetota bacterium]MCH9778111.1 hypothetical protein [Planctomycetota bacterium]MCH9789355.1 hypothetical protein [Planctomycetota bacterium]MDF1744296.1 hypothetical protein [Gimesia sp.]
MIFSKQNRRFVVKAINNSAFVKTAAVVKAIDAVRAALRLDSLNPLRGERLPESGGMPGTPSMSWHCCQHQSSMHLLYRKYMQITGARTTVTGTAS